MEKDELDILKSSNKGQRVRYEKKPVEKRITKSAYSKLSPMQRTFVHTYLLTEDKKLAMKEAGYSEKIDAGAILNKPRVREVVNEKREELWDKFKEYAEKALQVQVDMLDNPHVSYKVKLDASNSILDRAGYKPADRKEIVGAIGTIAVESKAVSDFANRARELLKAKGITDTNDIELAEVVDED